jgi:hypothetical protein
VGLIDEKKEGQKSHATVSLRENLWGDLQVSLGSKCFINLNSVKFEVF